MKTIYIRSDFLDRDTDISIDIENDNKEDILKELEKHTKNINLNMFDLEYVSEDEYTLNLNSLGEFYFKFKNNEYPDYFSEDVNCENFEKHINIKILKKAVINNNPNLVRDILNIKPKLINERIFNKVRETLVSLACDKGHIEIVKVLLEFSFYLKIQGIRDTIYDPDEYGSYPLSCACYNGNLEIVKLLLNPGFYLEIEEISNIINTCNKYGRTALYCAVCNDYLEIVKILLNPNFYFKTQEIPRATQDPDITGTSPLHLACSNGNLEMVKLLLDPSFYFNEPGIPGAVYIHNEIDNTPLHYACQSENLEIFLELVNPKYNLPITNNRNKHDKTPIDLARDYDCIDILNFLEEYFNK